MFEAVLFDLDGTLADTAPDLGGVVNMMREEEKLAALPLELLRPYVSQGVRGLLQAGFGMTADHPDYERRSERFLELYASNICARTRLFAGISELLVALEAADIPWGIVTNKRERFTLPLVAALGLSERTACVVSGDTTAAPKPSPLPILYACERLACRPQQALYVGDDRRDVEAGRAAGTLTAIVSYGYLGDGGPLETWNADFIADHPAQLQDYVLGARNG